MTTDHYPAPPAPSPGRAPNIILIIGIGCTIQSPPAPSSSVALIPAAAAILIGSFVLTTPKEASMTKTLDLPHKTMFGHATQRQSSSHEAR